MATIDSLLVSIASFEVSHHEIFNAVSSQSQIITTQLNSTQHSSTYLLKAKIVGVGHAFYSFSVAGLNCTPRLSICLLHAPNHAHHHATVLSIVDMFSIYSGVYSI
uniref:Uncharacterized protein n=1 Tax=Chaetoceros debilis TaxID=122233 RepID=A0A7S3Q4P6_9STRA